MAGFPERPSGALRRSLRSRVALLVGLLVVVWLIVPLVPESTGLRFGWVYQIFFSTMALLGVLLFWLLGKESVRPPRQPGAVLGSVAAAVLVTVGLLVAAGVGYPQFSPPTAPKAVADDAADRGRALFLSPSIGCFRCHKISGQGGIRGPDLTDVAGRAGGRVPELAGGEYLLEKIKAGSAFRYQVPKYAPMMPPFRTLAKEKQLKDIVAYLLALKPSTAPGGDNNGDGPVGD